MNTRCSQKTKPSCIPIPNGTRSTKNSHLSTSTDLQKPSSQTPPNTQTTVKQLTSPPTPRTATATPHPQRPRKSPLLPTPTEPAEQNRDKIFISGPPQHYITRYHRNTTFSRLLQFQHQEFNHQQIALLPLPAHQFPAFSGPPTYNYRFHQQPYIPGPYQQSQHSFIQRPYYYIPQVPTNLPIFVINLLR